MTASSKRADQLAREHTEAAINTLVEVMYDGDAKPSDRIKAADSILDRGHGKPVQATIAIPLDKAARDALYDMTDEDLMAEAKRRMAERQPPIDVTPQPDQQAIEAPKLERTWKVADEFEDIPATLDELLK